MILETFKVRWNSKMLTLNFMKNINRFYSQARTLLYFPSVDRMIRATLMSGPYSKHFLRIELE
jgi:hypothetical protein